MKRIGLLFLILLPFSIVSQTTLNKENIVKVNERKILQYNDSTLLKCLYPSFDINGNFLFDSLIGNKYYYLTNTKTIGPLYTHSFSNMHQHHDTNKIVGEYYFQKELPFIYGPIYGKNLSYYRNPKSENNKYQAFAFIENDTLKIYINKLLIKTIANKDSDVEKKYSSTNWASLSNNGNYLYTFFDNGIHYLCDKSKIIDTSLNEFEKFLINEKNEIIYNKIIKEKGKEFEIYHRYFYIKNKVIGPIDQSLYESAFFENGGYFLANSFKRNNIILINNILIKDSNFSEIKRIIVKDSLNYLIIKETSLGSLIFTNGKRFFIESKNIISPSIDNKGNAICYLVKDYYLHRWVNGILEQNPVTKFGRRPNIISSNDNGELILEYQIKDSTYIYQNEKLLFKELSKYVSYHPLFSFFDVYLYYKNYDNGILRTYLEINDSSYVIENGSISNVLPKFKKNNLNGDLDSKLIVSMDIRDDFYYIIWKDDLNKFGITINGSKPHYIDDLNRIFYPSFYYKKQLTFFGIKDLSLFKFTLIE